MKGSTGSGTTDVVTATSAVTSTASAVIATAATTAMDTVAGFLHPAPGRTEAAAAASRRSAAATAAPDRRRAFVSRAFVSRAFVSRALLAAANRERGMSTAEYAVGTIAACAFAAILFKVVTGTEVQEMLSSLIDRALKTAG
ncbi:DUF4244 domain-containing protein [Nonomuraea indica]|uniref:DUF4244 domain-containing protein n=1 Tax=Nonomuraea indica TaxID=1581193 RepID=A0ABW7ZVG7_9ACTN